MLWLVPRFNPSWAVLVKRLFFFFFLRADYLRTAWHLGIFHWRKPSPPVPRKERRNIRQNGPCSPASLNLGDFFHPWGHLWEIKLRGLLGKIFWLFILQRGNSPHLNIKWWHEKGVGHPGQEKVVCALFFFFFYDRSSEGSAVWKGLFKLWLCFLLLHRLGKSHHLLVLTF